MNKISVRYLIHSEFDYLTKVPSEHFSFLFYEFNLSTQGFVYLEIVKYQLGLLRNEQVLMKCNECISAVQLFSIQTCPGFLPISK